MTGLRDRIRVGVQMRTVIWNVTDTRLGISQGTRVVPGMTGGIDAGKLWTCYSEMCKTTNQLCHVAGGDGTVNQS